LTIIVCNWVKCRNLTPKPEEIRQSIEHFCKTLSKLNNFY
ncbi:uncharacterized protein Dsimw501_GD29607, partial [Drosophila simulans]